MINLHYNVVCHQFRRLTYAMLDIREQRQYLSELGIRLKTLRLARNDTMAVFARDSALRDEPDLSDICLAATP